VQLQTDYRAGFNLGIVAVVGAKETDPQRNSNFKPVDLVSVKEIASFN
jgi:hypothetical protein